MRRGWIAVLLGFALISTTSQLSTLHTHAYADHDHPEHHHGLAAHEHALESHPRDTEVHLESCDPGQHAVSLVLGRAALPDAQIVAAGSDNSSVVESLIPSRRARELTDVRAHGPPQGHQASPRAPPFFIPA